MKNSDIIRKRQEFALFIGTVRCRGGDIENFENLKKIAYFLKRKEVLFCIALGLAVFIYVLFFKPNPTVRVNWNKLQASGNAAEFIIDAPAEVQGVGKEFSVNVKINTKGYLVNAVSSYVSFDSRVLQVQSVNTEKSFCKFYIENNWSNEKGLVKLSCGAPYPGFRGENTIQTITFLTKAIKATDLHITNESMILANDGKGTNLLKEYPTVGVKIKAVL